MSFLLAFAWKTWRCPSPLSAAFFCPGCRTNPLGFGVRLLARGRRLLLVWCRIGLRIWLVCWGRGRFGSLVFRRTNSRVGWIAWFVCSRFTFGFVIYFSVFRICLVLRLVYFRRIVSISRLLILLFLCDLLNLVKLTFFLFFFDRRLLLLENILARLNLEYKTILCLIFRWILALMSLKIILKFHIFLSFQLCAFGRI